MTGEPITVRAEGVSVRYPRAQTVALREVSLTVNPGATIGFVGESGSGKSTLAKLLVGVLQPTSGEVTVNGTPWDRISRRDDRRRKVQMVFQDPYGSLNPRQSVLQTVAEVHQVWNGMTRRASLSAAAANFEQVGLASQFHNAHPRQLSGGQCQRVGIARALATDPEVLVADEPTSALDVSLQAGILNLLNQLRKERDLAVVLVSHDLAVVRYLTEYAMVLRGGEVVERGETVRILKHPEHPYTQTLVASSHY